MDYLRMLDHAKGHLFSKFKNTEILFASGVSLLNLCIFSNVSSHGASHITVSFTNVKSIGQRLA